MSPTDSCRDRLASFLFWNDFSGVEQALAVLRAYSTEVEFDAIRAWCKREGQLEKFSIFESRAITP